MWGLKNIVKIFKSLKKFISKICSEQYAKSKARGK